MFWAIGILQFLAVVFVLLIVVFVKRELSAVKMPQKWEDARVNAFLSAVISLVFLLWGVLLFCLYFKLGLPPMIICILLMALVFPWGVSLFSIIMTCLVEQDKVFRNTQLYRKKPTRGWLVSFDRVVFYEDYEPSKYCFSKWRRWLGMEHFVKGWIHRNIQEKWPDGRYFCVEVDIIANGQGSPTGFIQVCESLEVILKEIAGINKESEIKTKFENLSIPQVVTLRCSAVTLAIPKVIIPAFSY